MIIINLSFLFSQSHFKKLEVLVRSNPLQLQPFPRGKIKPNQTVLPFLFPHTSEEWRELLHHNTSLPDLLPRWWQTGAKPLGDASSLPATCLAHRSLRHRCWLFSEAAQFRKLCISSHSQLQHGDRPNISAGTALCRAEIWADKGFLVSSHSFWTQGLLDRL